MFKHAWSNSQDTRLRAAQFAIIETGLVEFQCASQDTRLRAEQFATIIATGLQAISVNAFPAASFERQRVALLWLQKWSLLPLEDGYSRHCLSPRGAQRWQPNVVANSPFLLG